MFRKRLLTLTSLLEDDTYGIDDPLAIRLLNRFRLTKTESKANWRSKMKIERE